MPVKEEPPGSVAMSTSTVALGAMSSAVNSSNGTQRDPSPLKSQASSSLRSKRTATTGSATPGTFSMGDTEGLISTTTEGTNEPLSKKSNRQGYTDLMRAAYSGDIQRVAELVLRDASRNKNVRLVKHGKSSGEGVSLLIERDKGDKTALDWARMAHQNHIAHFLEQAIMAQQKRQRRLEEIENRRTELEGLLRRNEQACRDLDKAIWGRDVKAMLEVVAGNIYTREQFRYAYESIKMVAAGKGTDTSNNQGTHDDLSIQPGEGESRHSYAFDGDTYFLDWETRMGGTALILASVEADVQAVASLATRGVRLNHENRLGHTALTWAAVCGHDEVVETLLLKGADVEYTTKAEGKTALIHASYNGAAACVNILLDKLFDKILSDKFKLEKSGNKKAMMEQEDYDAALQHWMTGFERCINRTDVHGRTAMDYARERKHAQVVELLEMAHIRIELRYKRIQEDQHQVATVYCSQGCGFQDKREAIEYHEIRHCPNKKAGCVDCGEIMAASKVPGHQQHHCPDRIVHCPNYSSGCVDMMKFKVTDSHARFSCKFRMVACSLGCGAETVFHAQILHQSEYCPRREVICEMGCEAKLPKETMKMHIKSECPKRLVECRIKGCKEIMRAQDRDFHESMVCVQPCRWDCGRSIGPLWDRNLHESSLCPRRPTPCPLKCGLLSCYGEYLDAHMSSYCPNRKEPCRLGCGAILRAKELSLHEDPEKGDCPERLQRCRHDYQGKRLFVRRPGKEEEELCLVKEYHADTDSFRLLFADGDRYETHQLRNLDFRVRDEAAWTCGWLPAESMAVHLSCDCPSRLVLCPQGCGQRIRAGTLLERHVEEECDMGHMACPSGCGATNILRRDVFRHEEEDCPCRLDMCAHCGQQVMHSAMEAHRSSTRSGLGACPALPTRCPQGCGRTMRRDEVDAHTSQHCPKRFVTCDLCQDPRIWADELEPHQHDECPERTVVCPNGPCGESMAGKLLDAHMMDKCLHRLVRCECGADVVAHEHDLHKKDVCLAALRNCTLGCGKKVRLMDMDSHQRPELGGDCDKHYLLDGKIVECPLGCGEQFTYYQQMQHLSLYCENRLVECPRKVECGESMPFRLLAQHQAICPARSVPCGCEDSQCARTLRCWVEQRVGPREGAAEGGGQEGQTAAEDHAECSLVACEQHGSTALAWAVQHRDGVLARHLLDLLYTQGTAVVAAAMRKEDKVTGATPLTIACARGYDNIVLLMLERGAAVNFETSSGRTPLIEACKAGHLGVAKLLVKYGAVVEHVPRHRKTAIDHADWGGYQDLVEFLVFTYRVQTDARRMFVMIARHDVAGIRKLLHPGERYRSNQLVLLESERDALRAKLKERRDFLEDCVADKARITGDIDSLNKNIEPKKAKVDRMSAEAESLYTETQAMLSELMAYFQDAMLALRAVESGDVLELQNMRDPSPEVLRVVKAVLLLLGIGPTTRKHLLYPKHQVQDWWTPALELFRQRDVLHTLRHYNKKAVPKEALRVIRDELLPHGGLDYEQSDTSFAFIYAMARWVKAIEMYERVGSLIHDRTLHEADLRQASLITHEDYRVERDMVEMRTHRLKYLDVDIATLQDECHSLRRHIGEYQEKIRLATLFEWVSYSGHTLVSWAGAVGTSEIMALLLAHGGSLGWGAEYEVLLSNAIKTLWKARKAREVFKKRGKVTAEQRGLTMQLAWALKKVTSRMVKVRRQRRSPLTEAFYNANYDVPDRLLEHQTQYLSAALYTYNQPVAPPPGPGLQGTGSSSMLIADFTEGSSSTVVRLSVVDYANRAFEDRACCDFVHSVGWTRKDHPMARWMENKATAAALYSALAERKKKAALGAVSRRVKKKTMARLKALEAGVEKAINSPTPDWKAVMRLLDQGVDPDYEQPGGGLTCLLAAAGEDPEAMGYQYAETLKDRGVMALEQLLNRNVNRPTVDFETAVLGHTALTWAAYHGRLATMQMLVERGADVRRANREGMTALMFAAMNGKAAAVSMLLEMGADSEARDVRNKRAIEFGQDYVDVLEALRRMENCNLGPAKAKLGTAQPRVACLRGCGLVLLRTDMQAHVTTQCPNRLVSCQWGCGVVDLFAKEKDDHEDRECAMRRRACPFGCGEVLLGLQMDAHMAQQCSKRFVPCPEKCDEGQIRLDHLSYHRLHECSHRLVPCPFECGLSVRFFEVFRHRRTECKLRKVRCRVTCGMEMFARDRNRHETEVCPNRQVTCRYGCSMSFKACEQRHHEEEACNKRPRPCPNKCGEMPMADDVKNHMGHHCPFRFIPCQKGCGLKVRAADMERHTEQGDCPYRQLLCPLGCGLKMLQERMEAHVTDKCPHKPIHCSQCGVAVKRSELAGHKAETCPRRRVQCVHHALGCAKVMPADEKQEHETAHCKKRMVMCLQGCKHQMRLDKRELHHRRQCPLRYEACPQGCGKSIREVDREEHMVHDCVRRPLNNDT